MQIVWVKTGIPGRVLSSFPLADITKDHKQICVLETRGVMSTCSQGMFHQKGPGKDPSLALLVAAGDPCHCLVYGRITNPHLCRHLAFSPVNVSVCPNASLLLEAPVTS